MRAPPYLAGLSGSPSCETQPDPVMLTSDTDFNIYRRHDRQIVPACCREPQPPLRNTASMSSSVGVATRVKLVRLSAMRLAWSHSWRNRAPENPSVNGTRVWAHASTSD